MSFALLAMAGRVSAPQFEAALLLVPALAVGAVVSRLIHDRFMQRFWRVGRGSASTTGGAIGWRRTQAPMVWAGRLQSRVKLLMYPR